MLVPDEMVPALFSIADMPGICARPFGMKIRHVKTARIMETERMLPPRKMGKWIGAVSEGDSDSQNGRCNSQGVGNHGIGWNECFANFHLVRQERQEGGCDFLSTIHPCRQCRVG